MYDAGACSIFTRHYNIPSIRSVYFYFYFNAHTHYRKYTNFVNIYTSINKALFCLLLKAFSWVIPRARAFEVMSGSSSNAAMLSNAEKRFVFINLFAHEHLLKMWAKTGWRRARIVNYCFCVCLVKRDAARRSVKISLWLSNSSANVRRWVICMG